MREERTTAAKQSKMRQQPCGVCVLCDVSRERMCVIRGVNLTD